VGPFPELRSARHVDLLIDPHPALWHEQMLHATGIGNVVEVLWRLERKGSVVVRLLAV
jgi:hypothetical protein